MYLEIVTPEAVLLSSEVESVTVPGINGEFQMLNNHAPIVSVLGKGTVKISTSQPVDLESISPLFTRDTTDDTVLLLPIDGGVIEMKDNKVIVLAD